MNYRIDTLKCIFKLAGIKGILKYIGSKLYIDNEVELCKVYAQDIVDPLFIRLPSSDFLTYWQVFSDKEYDLNFNNKPNFIIDAGANVGLASVYFANRFPDAKIIAIEPEIENFVMLKKNISPYPNVEAVHAALWCENKEINLIDPGLGSSGFMTCENIENSVQESKEIVNAITIDWILKHYNFDRVDILKIDIEGAESEVFQSSNQWIDSIESIVIELHERMKPGSSASFLEVANLFKYKWKKGENICVARSGNILSPDLHHALS